MGETTSLTNEKPEQLEHRIEALRGQLTQTLDELDVRRRELMDFKLQVKRHPGIVAAVAGGVALLLGATVGYAIYDSRRQHKLSVRYRRLKKVLRTAVVQEPESITHRIATTAAGALTGLAIKQLGEQLVEAQVQARTTRPNRLVAPPNQLQLDSTLATRAPA